MKIFNKIIILLLAATALSFSACSDDDDYTPGSQTNADSVNVYFNSAADVTLLSDVDSFVVTVSRNSSKGELSVPLTLESSNGYDSKGKAIFTIPTVVTFKDGESKANIIVESNDSIKMFNSYHVTISVPESYTTQYVSNPVGQPRAELNIVKEDYVDYAKGTYSSDFFGDETKEAVMQYSAVKDNYRFKKVAEGQTFTFSVNDNDSISYNWSTISSGYIDESEGEVSIVPSTKKDFVSYYDPKTKTYYFGFKYVVSAGNYGSHYDRFVVTSKY